MATVYIQSGTGTGSGTKADPYYYSELGTAETAAGNGGTILFTDGTYTFLANQTWDAGGFADMTYKSENDFGAYLLGSVAIIRLTIGSGTTTTMKIEGFKQGNIYWYGNAATTFSINKIKHVDTISGTRAGLGIFVPLSATNLNSITNSSFLIDYSGSDRFMHTANATTLDSCSFFFKCSSVASNGITGFGGPGASTNTIFMSDNAAAIDATVIATSLCTNCCIHQMNSSSHTSGGTNNVFADPQFVDPANDDLRLRPSSPCINAGTSS